MNYELSFQEHNQTQIQISRSPDFGYDPNFQTWNHKLGIIMQTYLNKKWLFFLWIYDCNNQLINYKNLLIISINPELHTSKTI